MPDNNLDFQHKVKTLAGLKAVHAVRDCYGVSNCAKFVTGGFLCGIPNIDNLDSASEALCVFSKIQLSPSSELHTALLIRRDLPALLGRMKAMASSAGDFFADKNNNCALFLYSDGKVYAYNKAKVTFELTADILRRIGPGIGPDAVFWAVYGNREDARGGPVGQLAALVGKDNFVEVKTEELPSSNPKPSGIQSLVGEFHSACNTANFKISKPLICRFASALQSKRFLIATGLAGSGKTKLAQAFARWITPKHGNVVEANPHYAMIPVGADWTGNENVLGYPNGLDQENYVTKPALDLILHAKSKPDIPHFLILDEMNLSHVERYFADILSAIESEEEMPIHQDKERKANGKTVPNKIGLPKNLFIIGTVNVDETTYMFSPKVLDRANVIEFRVDTGDLESFLSNSVKPDLSTLDGKGAPFGKTFVEDASSPVDVPADVKAAYEAEMLLFFKVQQTHGAEFGYRVAHEAARFVCHYKLLGNYPDGDTSWFPKAFDCVVVQKFLPKLHGSRAKLGPLLKKLWFLCANDVAGRGSDPLKAAEEAARSTDKKTEPSVGALASALYPLSAEKISRMWRLLNENGFTSFAEA